MLLAGFGRSFAASLKPYSTVETGLMTNLKRLHWPCIRQLTRAMGLLCLMGLGLACGHSYSVHFAAPRDYLKEIQTVTIVISEVPMNRLRPVSISKKTAPKEKMSDRLSIARPHACSGDM